jgi:alkylation response protein AidB-like acyl-CoA dehydrogenase
MSYRRTTDFLLYDWLDVESLQKRPRFADHSRETFASVMDTCEKIARDKYAPFNRLADTEEPWFDGEKVHLPEASHAAAKAYAESGMLAAAQDYEIGGMQLPCVVEMAANSFFSKAGIGIGGGGMLTSGNANLLMAHGAPMQQKVFAQQEFAGRFSGTMCLSEPVRRGHARGSRRRRFRGRCARAALPAAWQQDVDQQRRARAEREHRPPGARENSGARRQTDRRHQGHLAVHRAEVSGWV